VGASVVVGTTPVAGAALVEGDGITPLAVARADADDVGAPRGPGTPVVSKLLHNDADTTAMTVNTAMSGPGATRVAW
jgi:hypothetical protein